MFSESSSDDDGNVAVKNKKLRGPNRLVQSVSWVFIVHGLVVAMIE